MVVGLLVLLRPSYCPIVLGRLYRYIIGYSITLPHTDLLLPGLLTWYSSITVIVYVFAVNSKSELLSTTPATSLRRRKRDTKNSSWSPSKFTHVLIPIAYLMTSLSCYWTGPLICYRATVSMRLVIPDVTTCLTTNSTTARESGLFFCCYPFCFLPTWGFFGSSSSLSAIYKVSQQSLAHMPKLS